MTSTLKCLLLWKCYTTIILCKSNSVTLLERLPTFLASNSFDVSCYVQTESPYHDLKLTHQYRHTGKTSLCTLAIYIEQMHCLFIRKAFLICKFVLIYVESIKLNLNGLTKPARLACQLITVISEQTNSILHNYKNIIMFINNYYPETHATRTFLKSKDCQINTLP